MRDKIISEKLKAFRELNCYTPREGVVMYTTAGNIHVEWYSRGDIAVQVGDNDDIVCGIRELSDVIREVI